MVRTGAVVATWMVLVLSAWGAAAESKAAAATPFAYSVEWGPEVVSFMGPDGDPSYDAHLAAAAYNPSDHEFLVVWCGDLAADPLVDDEFEVWGQRVDAETGASLGSRIRISRMGVDGSTATQACFVSSRGPRWSPPDVAYNRRDHEYLVVWSGDGRVDGKFEIFGQRLAAGTETLEGSEILIGSMGGAAATDLDAYDPAVAYDSTANEFLVVWSGDDDTEPLSNEEFEIHGRRIGGASGSPAAGRFRISQQGPDSGATKWDWDAVRPDVAYNAVDTEYLVVWQGANVVSYCPGCSSNYVWFEIFAQRITGGSDTEVGADARISDMSPLESGGLWTRYCSNQTCNEGFDPAVEHNRSANEYLVVWSGDAYGICAGYEFEIFGQRLAGATAMEIPPNDFRISQMGPDSDKAYDAQTPDVAHDSAIDQYLVVWDGDDEGPAITEGEFEVFGQRLAGADASDLGGDFRISFQGPDKDTGYAGWDAAVSADASTHRVGVFWSGDDISPFAAGDFEIRGQGQGEAGACGAADSLNLMAMTIRAQREFRACDTLSAGGDFEVAAGGDVTLRAGSLVTVGDGFASLDGSTLTIVLQP